jgi:homopolymeric O-antigen transport system ATP-binding protein
MDQDLAISVKDLGKAFRLGLEQERSDTLFGSLSNAAKAPFRNLRNLRRLDTASGGEGEDTLWAVRDVSFDVKKGEVLGIIGRNGAGKSTLLKILSRITEPTTGEIRMRGRVSSLLEVGTGFHPELTGRENIYMNGTILGMRKTEIDQKFDEIVDFSGVERFLDTPIKRYSSGQKVRLAFSVAAHLEPEILIVDEVLAVGDADFQRKCIGRMKQVSQGGERTVLFVSHNMAAIAGLCDKAIILSEGRKGYEGGVEEAVQQYIRLNSDDEFASEVKSDHIQRISLDDGGRKAVVRCGESLDISLFPFQSDEKRFNEVGIVLLDAGESRVAAFHSAYNSDVVIAGTEYNSIQCNINSLPLVPGRYTVEVNIGESGKVLEKISYAAVIDVVFSDVYGTGKLPSQGQGVVCLPVSWQICGSER